MNSIGLLIKIPGSDEIKSSDPIKSGREEETLRTEVELSIILITITLVLGTEFATFATSDRDDSGYIHH
jgi:hypothetical protein